jgi:hypothetical protein
LTRRTAVVGFAWLMVASVSDSTTFSPAFTGVGGVEACVTVGLGLLLILPRCGTPS